MRRRLFLFAGVLLSLGLLAVAALVGSGLHDTLAPADIALVLGNTVQPDGRPSARLQAQLDRTLELYRQHLFPLVIASGGLGKEGYDEAAVMADYLAAGGIPRTAIIEDHEGVTTWASARFTAAHLPNRGQASVLAISQYFHLPRTALALRKFGVGTVYTAHAHYFEARDLYSIPRELVGYLSYRLRSMGPLTLTKLTAPPAPPASGR